MKYLSGLVLVTLTVCVVGIIAIAALSNLSGREYLFLTVLLTCLAIAASWLATNLASKSNTEQMRNTLRSEHTEKLRTYALQASEKVQNLSAEMERLTDYIKESPISGEGVAIKTAVERFKTVRLMLETIKSVNDTALSDWRGIIADELREQGQIQSDIDTIFGKLEEIEESITTPTGPQASMSIPGIGRVSTGVGNWGAIASYDYDAKLQELDKNILEYASRSPIPVRIPKRIKIDAIVKCPKCGVENKSKVNLKAGYRRVTRCENCGNFFEVNVGSDMNIGTDKVETKEEEVTCVLCDSIEKVTYPAWQGYVLKWSCRKCHSVSLISVGGDEKLKIRQSEKISKKFLEILEQIVGGEYPSTEDISGIAREFGVGKSKVTQGLTVLLSLGRIESPEEELEEGEEAEEGEEGVPEVE